MRQITRLVLEFPWGASVEECDHIARKAEDVIMAGVSEGGFMPTNKYGLNVEDVTFSDDTMSYTFGYNRLQEGK